MQYTGPIIFVVYLRKGKILTMKLSILLGIPGGWQILLIVVVVLLLFGGKKIPEMMRGLGRGVREFKDGIAGEDDAKNKEEQGKKEK
jgi:sec-independent protein translocase protein TatA